MRTLDRRNAIGLIAGGAAGMTLPGRSLAGATVPSGSFLWGAATAGHQVEGNNYAADMWLLEDR